MIKKKFVSQPSAIASYDYVDIAEGTGIVVFYGSVTKNNAATNYYLTTTKTYSGVIAPQTSAGTTNYSKRIDADFDVEFNQPKDIKGKAYLSVTQGGFSTAGFNGVRVYVKATLKHYDGTTETTIGSTQQSVETNCVGAGATTSKSISLLFDITSNQHFKRGDILRLTLECWGKINASGAGCCGFGADPMDRDDDITYKTIEDAHTTVLQLNVPFRLTDI